MREIENANAVKCFAHFPLQNSFVAFL